MSDQALATTDSHLPNAVTGANLDDFVTFMIGEQLFGIPVLQVQDILQPDKIASIPLAPPEVKGSINLRGRIVTVFNVRQRLGLDPLPEDEEKQSMGVTVELQHELYTLEVDGVGDVIGLPEFDASHVRSDLARNKLETATGRLVIEVPSSEDALLTLYDSDAFQRFTYWSQHLYLFNADTLRNLTAQAGLRVVSIQQIQRYPLSNHLYWLSRNLPGGHQHWSFLDTPALAEAYTASLGAAGKCDTLIAHLEKNLT